MRRNQLQLRLPGEGEHSPAVSMGRQAAVSAAAALPPTAPQLGPPMGHPASPPHPATPQLPACEFDCCLPNRRSVLPPLPPCPGHTPHRLCHALPFCLGRSTHHRLMAFKLVHSSRLLPSICWISLQVHIPLELKLPSPQALPPPRTPCRSRHGLHGIAPVCEHQQWWGHTTAPAPPSNTAAQRRKSCLRQSVRFSLRPCTSACNAQQRSTTYVNRQPAVGAPPGL
jgi:hypothetical protein